MPRRTISPAKLAEKLLEAGSEDMELLREHDFKDDEAMHDDALHERLRAEFSAELDEVKEAISRLYGKPIQTGNKDNRLIPLNGAVRYAVWRAGKKRLFVAAAREERECPFLLVLGVIPGR
jgi:hypothetical protein